DELRKVGDNHSFVQTKTVAENYTKSNSTPLKPKAKLLEKNIGYIYVPGFTSTNDSISKLFTDTIQNLIKNLDTRQKINGWVVDLRDNTGGNMFPMIAGLGSLIGEGTLGYFIKKNTDFNMNSRWYYKNGIAGNGKNLSVTDIKEFYKIKNPKYKIAVLISNKTSSSGEMTAISFIGKKNVKLFGQHSGSYTTGNVSFKLSDGSALVLACSLVADRNQKKYLHGIEPDVVTKKSNTEFDEAIRVASSWLLN
ncbi:MAG: S41 family peptidase, partial [Oligoflexus sp.]|nr:S41 family peptidase [Pseudopedobacter sp.]